MFLFILFKIWFFTLLIDFSLSFFITFVLKMMFFFALNKKIMY